MHVYFHTSLTHTCDREPPASMWVWPAACVCVSMHVAMYVYVYAYISVCMLQCYTLGGIVACASYALLSSRARCTEKAKVLGGWEVTQALFSIAKTLLSILPPSVHPYKQMSELELKEKSITPSYIENIILVENQMSCCLRAVWDMLAVWGIWKKNTVYICSIRLFISSIFKMPALVQRLYSNWVNWDIQLGQFSIYFFIFFQLPPLLSKNGTLTGLDFICQSFFMSPANDLSV